MGRGPVWTKEEDIILKKCWKEIDSKSDRITFLDENLSNRSTNGALQRISILFGKKPKREIKRGSPRKLKMKRGKYSNKELETLYQCWRDGVTKTATIELIKQNMPRRVPSSAYQQVYTLSKEDPKWKKLATRRQNAKKQKKQSVEEKREEGRKIREEKKKELKKKSLLFRKKDFIVDNLTSDHVDEIQEMMELDFFFCQKQKSFTTNIACIFRKFSKADEYGFKFSGVCDKCRKFDEYTDAIYKMLKGENKK